MSGETYTALELEAALCVWECINDWTLIDGTKRDDWVALREALGTGELRYQSSVLGKWCLAVYDRCKAQDENVFDGLAYDWEVIPSILALCRKDQGPVIYADAFPEVEPVAVLVLAKFQSEQWRAACKQQAVKQWGYADLIDDLGDLVQAAQQAGADAAEFIKEEGERLDLIPAESWHYGGYRS